MLPIIDVSSLPSTLGKRMQIGLVVRDLDEAMRFWAEEMRIGPWVVLENNFGNGRRFNYRGDDSDVDLTAAHSYVGDTQIELVVQHNSTPSPYSAFLEAGRQGLHHLGFWPDDYEQSCNDLERMGFEEVAAIYQPTGEKNASYYSSPSHLGIVVELCPWTPVRSKQLGAIEVLAKNWDGTRAVRRFENRDAFFASEDFLSTGLGS